MAKEIKYKITLLRFLISTFFTLFVVGCETGYEVKDASATSGAADVPVEPPRAWRRLFVSTTTHNGNLGGKTGADAKCMAPGSGKPATGTYKALIVDSATRAVLPAPTDWVLSASTEYRRLDDTTVIGTTTASRIFDDNVPLDASFDATANLYSWTGLYNYWGTTSYHCNNWTDGTAGETGYTGYTGSNPSNYEWGYNYNGQTCNQLRHLICVEQ